jgi:molybdopterin-guanine dinucleotide biosynthesis protein A
MTMSSLTPDMVTPYILMGDKSSLFGVDHRMLEVHGRPLLANLALLVRAALHKTPVFVGDDPIDIELRGSRWLGDAKKGSGPLGGLVSALRDCATEWALILAVDLPGLALADIWTLMDDDPGDAELQALGLKDMVEPLAGLYRQTTLPVWEEALDTSHATLQTGIARLRTKVVHPASGQQAIMHLN